LSDNFPYNSLHEYLDDRFADCKSVSDTDIQNAKREYRKHYLKAYYDTYQRQNIQISFRIPKRRFQDLEKLAKTNSISVTTYLRRLALETQNLNTDIDMKRMRILLLKSMDALEDYIEQGSETLIYKALKHLEAIGTLLTSDRKSHQS